jgi:hypothetical protein
VNQDASAAEYKLPFLVEHHMKALRLSLGAAHETVPRLLVIFFDFGKHLMPSRAPDARDLLDGLRQAKKDTILSEMRAKFAALDPVVAAAEV